MNMHLLLKSTLLLSASLLPCGTSSELSSERPWDGEEDGEEDGPEIMTVSEMPEENLMESLAKYSIKYQRCHEEYRGGDDAGLHRSARGLAEQTKTEATEEGFESFVGEMSPVEVEDAIEDYTIPQTSKNERLSLSFVTFRFCVSQAMDGPACDACLSEYGEIVVDMKTYLRSMMNYKQMQMEIYCNTCYECIENENRPVGFGSEQSQGGGRVPDDVPVRERQRQGGDQDFVIAKEEISEPFEGEEPSNPSYDKCASMNPSQCRDECEDLQSMGGDAHYLEFIDCQLIYKNEDTNEVYYVGPSCNEYGQMQISIFLDEECTIRDDTKEKSSYLNDDELLKWRIREILFHQTFVSDDCVASCIDEDDNDRNRRQIQEDKGDMNVNMVSNANEDEEAVWFGGASAASSGGSSVLQTTSSGGNSASTSSSGGSGASPFDNTPKVNAVCPTLYYASSIVQPGNYNANRPNGNSDGDEEVLDWAEEETWEEPSDPENFVGSEEVEYTVVVNNLEGKPVNGLDGVGTPVEGSCGGNWNNQGEDEMATEPAPAPATNQDVDTNSLDHMGEDKDEDKEIELGAVEEPILWDEAPPKWASDEDGDFDEQLSDYEEPVDTCTCKNEAGIWWAGKFCEHKATAMCQPSRSGTEQFCTNGGECIDREIPAAHGRICNCPVGFYGRYCEWIVEVGVPTNVGEEMEEQEEEDEDEDEYEYEEISEIDEWDWDSSAGGDDTHDEEEKEKEEEEFGGNGIDWMPDVPVPFPININESMDYSEREREALVGFYNSVRGDNWGSEFWSDIWLSETSVCNWYGVGCNEYGSVTSLTLRRNSIEGSLTDLGNLFLRHLGNLTELDLEGNSIKGEITDGISIHLPRLTRLNLANNEIRGAIPFNLGLYERLESLELQSNYLDSFWIPDNGYSKLRNLDLSDNRLMGTVQFDLPRLHGLVNVSLSGNNLRGALHTDYSPLVGLAKFDVSHNMISGVLSEGAFNENPKLQYLNLSHNNLESTIPEGVMELAFSESEGLHVLDFSFNMFEGAMPNFDVDFLDIRVAGNMLKQFALGACDHLQWNYRLVYLFECDGIACAVGTANAQGHQTSVDDPCKPCDTADYIGTVGCKEEPEPQDHFDWGADPDDEIECTLKCLNGGRCIAWYGSVAEEKCECPVSYFGVACEQHIPSPPQKPLSSSIHVISPDSLANEVSYGHQVALFGPPNFFGKSSIVANVYYTDSDLCDSNNLDPIMGYPFSEIDEVGNEPFIFMVDRGSCTFVQKVRNAQSIGAWAVIFANNACLCMDLDEMNSFCVSDPGVNCEQALPVLADDGTAEDITIPSFIMLKQDADRIKADLKANKHVMMEMTIQTIPLPSMAEPIPVRYELWMTPANAAARAFLLGFKETAVSLRGFALFTPRFYIIDGVELGCTDATGENDCSNMCTNNGRYCGPNLDDDFDVGISGADVVRESMHWICIWELFGANIDGVGLQWWDYVSHFIEKCSTPDLFADKECVSAAMEIADIPPEKIFQCVEDYSYGGMDSDERNKLLEEQIYIIQDRGITRLPTFHVDQKPVDKAFNSDNALNAICARVVADSAPPVCKAATGLRPTTPPPDTESRPPLTSIEEETLEVAASNEDVIGYTTLGRGSCQDSLGKMYSFIQSKFTDFPDAAICASEECDRFQNLQSYRGFEFSVAKRCTCLFDKDALPSILESEPGSQAQVSKVNDGNGEVASVSGTPGATCYKTTSYVVLENADGAAAIPASSTSTGSFVDNATFISTSPVPSFEPSSAPSFEPTSKPSMMPTEEPTEEPTIFSTESSPGAHDGLRYRALLYITSFLLSVLSL